MQAANPPSDGLFSLSANQLHSEIVAQLVAELKRNDPPSTPPPTTTTPTPTPYADEPVTEDERNSIHQDVHSVLASMFAPELPPVVKELPTTVTSLDGRVNCGNVHEWMKVSAFEYTIEMRLPQGRMRYAWVYAHEYAHIIVRGWALMNHKQSEGARQEALAELIALLCFAYLSRTSAFYSSNYIAHALALARESAGVAENTSTAVLNETERNACVYGGGLVTALSALADNPHMSLEAQFIPYFLASHFSGTGPLSSCTASSVSDSSSSSTDASITQSNQPLKQSGEFVNPFADHPPGKPQASEDASSGRLPLPRRGALASKRQPSSRSTPTSQQQQQRTAASNAAAPSSAPPSPPSVAPADRAHSQQQTAASAWNISSISRSTFWRRYGVSCVILGASVLVSGGICIYCYSAAAWKKR